MLKLLLLLTSLSSISSFAMGSKKPWYDGPKDRKPTMEGWINHSIDCMNAPGFKKDKVRIKYTPVKGVKKFSSGWAYQSESGGAWVHGETYLDSRTNFRVKVATTPQGQFDRDANATEGHEVGHVVAWNQFGISSHDPKFKKCFEGWMDFESHDIMERVYLPDGTMMYDSSITEAP